VAKGVRRATGQYDLFDEDVPDPSAERSRATMWDVPRFAEAMIMRGRPYRAIVVENVVDAVKWMFWPAWLAAMDAAGYAHHVVYLNSAFAHGKDYNGAPQYRDRIYVVFWRKDATAPDLDIRPPGWCPTCETQVDAIQSWKRPFERPWGRYRVQYTYRCPVCRGEVEPFALPAAAAIDWSDLGGRIGERGRPLAKATRERIRAGLARYGRAPLMTPAGGTWNESAMPATVPMRVRTARETEGITCPPMLVPVEARDGLRPRTADEPLRTQTGRLETALVAGGEPFLAMLRQNVAPTSTRDPLGTVVAAGNHHGLVLPEAFLAILRGRSVVSRVDEPLSTMTASGGHHGLTTPPSSMLMAYYGNGTCSPTSAPVPTLSTRDRFALITRVPEQVADDEIDACSFRMLAPVEVLAAMAFPGDYLMKGTKRDRVRMAGNAVTPPAARLIAERVLAALEADR
jgi:DNA (cytosine-5)-methyltransferase 1